MRVPFGKYVLHERIGSGGMAEVWSATLPGAGGIDKRCVIKRILPAYVDEPAIVQMFLDEARISISLQHGNIVPVFDFGEVDGSHYLAMEHVAGKDLRAIRIQAAKKAAPFPIGIAVFVVIEVCKGLSYAHSKVGPDGRHLGLVHRDVSPTNILVSWEGTVRLVDFGIAKVRAKGIQTLTPGLKGKVPYMSPEQARCEPVDARTDIYATGVVLYELLTGRRPFDGDDRVTTLDLVRRGLFDPPRALRPDVPEELDEVVRIALALDREQRFHEARAMQVVLGRFLAKLDSTLTSTDLEGFLRSLFPDEFARTRQPPPVTVTDPLEKALLLAAGEEPGPKTEQAAIRPTVPERTSGAPAVEDAFPRTASAAVASAPARSSAGSQAAISTSSTTATPTSVSAAASRVDIPGSRKLSTSLAVAALVLVAAGVGAWSVSGSPVETPDASVGVPPSTVPSPAASPSPVSSPSSAPSPSPSPSPTPSTSPSALTLPSRAAARQGTLIVGSQPWGAVFVDGRRRAESTPATLTLPAGRHRVLARNPDSGLEGSQTVEVRAGETARVVLRLH
ncbi:MAG: serine/threonine protein kinase [Deltaproteobacteria bacterium]|nr:serine/threonine protein kinase [Deltaproteobacteria bacterium]